MAVDEVQLDEAEIKRLISLYRDAYKDIISEISEATTFGKISRLQILRNIKMRLADLGDDIDSWVEQEIPKYYRQGANDAVKDLEELSIDLDRSKYFSQIHKEAIGALVSEVQLAFAESMQAIARNANRLLSTAQKMEINQIIAKGFIAAEDRITIAGHIKELLRRDGLTALVDRSGKRWSFDAYANMLVRTKAVEARNQGLGNRMAENGFDLVEVSNHNSTHEECRVWEGKILSFTGATPGYPTYNQALEAGLFHPNCKHAINVLSPELANRTQAYQNPFNAQP